MANSYRRSIPRPPRGRNGHRPPSTPGDGWAADAIPGPATPPVALPPSFDFTAESDALAADRVVDSACPTPAGHAALPTGDANPVVPGTLTPVADLNATAPDRAAFPLTGTVGRPSVVHFAEVTQWTYAGKQLNGVRLVQIHPATAAAAGIADGDAIRVESPLGSIAATASVFAGIGPDTVFVPDTFGPAQVVGDEFGLPGAVGAIAMPRSGDASAGGDLLPPRPAG